MLKTWPAFFCHECSLSSKLYQVRTYVCITNSGTICKYSRNLSRNFLFLLREYCLKNLVCVDEGFEGDDIAVNCLEVVVVCLCFFSFLPEEIA